MRISDWSSDVCSSDLRGDAELGAWHRHTQRADACGARGRAARRADRFGCTDHRCQRYRQGNSGERPARCELAPAQAIRRDQLRSEEHTDELQSLKRISYADYWWKTKREKDTKKNKK